MLIWKLKKTFLKDENHSELDITATKRKIRCQQVIGLARHGDVMDEIEVKNESLLKKLREAKIPGVAAGKKYFNQLLTENVVEPLARRGYENLGAGLATIPAVAADVVLPETFEEVAISAIPVGKVVKSVPKVAGLLKKLKSPVNATSKVEPDSKVLKELAKQGVPVETGYENARTLAKAYLDKLGKQATEAAPFKEVNADFATRVAQAYDEMKHAPDDPAVQKAYRALIDETKDQFELIKESGLKISRIEPGMENPYKSSKDLFNDIKNNNHMWYYPTTSGYGSEGASALTHPMLEATELTDGKNKLLANDVFRIVHDYFGHIKEGTTFGPRGEERAYRIHKTMYSPEAQKALASETRGQNSWVNFGPHKEQNRLDPKNTIYSEQKAGLLPDWALKDYTE